MIHIPLINGIPHDKLTTYETNLTLKATNARSNNGKLITDWQYYYYTASLTYEMVTNDEKKAIETELFKDFELTFVPTDSSGDQEITRVFRVLESKDVSRGQIYDLTDEILWKSLKINAECIVAEERFR